MRALSRGFLSRSSLCGRMGRREEENTTRVLDFSRKASTLFQTLSVLQYGYFAEDVQSDTVLRTSRARGCFSQLASQSTLAPSDCQSRTGQCKL